MRIGHWVLRAREIIISRKVKIAVLLAGLSLLWLGANGVAQAGGNDWTLLDGPYVPGGTVDALAISPSASDTLYALVQGHAGSERLFRSDDAATSWTQLYTFATRMDDLAVDPADPNTVYVGEPNGLYRSADGGLSWTEVYTVGSCFAAVSPTLLYAGGKIAEGDEDCGWDDIYGLARSEDGGDTWQMYPIGCAHELRAVVVHPFDPDIVYVSGSRLEGKLPLLVRSTDGGQTWATLPVTNLHTHSCDALVIDPVVPSRLYTSDYRGVLRSSDGGDTWERVRALSDGPYRLAVDAAGVLYAIEVYAPEGTAIYRSEDGGESWWVSLLRLPRGANALVAHPTLKGVLYTGLTGYGVFRSANGGSAWTERNEGIRTLASVSALAIARSDPNVVYAGADRPRGGLFRSQDGGLSWEEVITDTSILAVAVSPVTPTLAYAGGPDCLYRTQGESFAIHSVAVHPFTPTVVYAGSMERSKEGAVYRSYDGGGTWQRAVLDHVIYGVRALALDSRYPDTIFAGTSVQGVYRSTDGGQTWGRWSTGLGWEEMMVFALAVDELGIPYAGTGDGVQRWDPILGEWVPFGLQGQRIGVLSISSDWPQVLLAGSQLGGVWRRALVQRRLFLPLGMRGGL